MGTYQVLSPKPQFWVTQESCEECQHSVNAGELSEIQIGTLKANNR